MTALDAPLACMTDLVRWHLDPGARLRATASRADEDVRRVVGDAIWVVVAGDSRQGLNETKEEDELSPALPRLVVGSRVKQLDRVGERLHFELVSGDGPARGWLTKQIGGVNMLRRE